MPATASIRRAGRNIEKLWQAQFVDRQVRSALERLFSPEPDGAFVRFLKKRVNDLSAKEIRASLARVRARFDFPVEHEVARVTEKRAKQQTTDTITKPKSFAGVALKEVIDAGLLKPPLKLTVHYKGRDLEAELLQDGTVRFQGKTFKSCSAAAEFARGTVTGRRMNTNGWAFWHYKDNEGNLALLNTARQEYLKRRVK